MKKLVIFLAIFCSKLSIDAQTGIKGKIFDEKKEGLISAVIKIQKNNINITNTLTDFDGNYFVKLDTGNYNLEINYTGFKTQTISNVIVKENNVTIIDVKLIDDAIILSDVVIVGYSKGNIKSCISSGQVKMPTRNVNAISAATNGVNIKGSRANTTQYFMDGIRVFGNLSNDESYSKIIENKVIQTNIEQVSTFSLDVDKAAYSNIRRFINLGQLPPIDAIRIEEMINYFNYEYKAPKNNDILDVQTTVVECPWNKEHQLLHLGVQSKVMDTKDLPASNLVFLIDVSGSMNAPNKLPLVIQSFKLLLIQLRSIDKVAIVTYAGNAGVVLKSTIADNKNEILDCLEKLTSGGSTAGAQGILTAYEIAEQNFIKNGNNRVILATDGDFNVGISDNKSLEKLIEEKRKSGVFLSVLGFGYGNYKDEKLQILADKGNGNHAYIDDINEAQKVFVNEFGGTIYTLAKDVKFQIEFNPMVVSDYRLVGYENRLLENEDFNNDKIDAGELGMGHQMTAIYEINIYKNIDKKTNGLIDDLKYTSAKINNKFLDELGTIKFRYKKPDSEESTKWEKIIPNKIEKSNSEDVNFSIAVAYSGLLLRKSKYIEDGNFDKMLTLATDNSKLKDKEGYKAEFIKLMKIAKDLKPTEVAIKN